MLDSSQFLYLPDEERHSPFETSINFYSAVLVQQSHHIGYHGNMSLSNYVIIYTVLNPSAELA